MSKLAQHRVVAGRKTEKAPGLLWTVLVLWKLDRVVAVSEGIKTLLSRLAFWSCCYIFSLASKVIILPFLGTCFILKLENQVFNF